MIDLSNNLQQHDYRRRTSQFGSIAEQDSRSIPNEPVEGMLHLQLSFIWSVQSGTYDLSEDLEAERDI